MDSELERAFRYHAWSTRTLLEFCLELTAEQRRLTAPGTTGTIERTLTHLVSSEQIYLRDLSGEDPPRWIESKVMPLDDLLERATENQTRWVGYLAGGLDPNEVITTDWRGHERSVVRWASVVQALMHGAEHRAHVGTVLGANGIGPPDLSVGAYANVIGSAADQPSTR